MRLLDLSLYYLPYLLHLSLRFISAGYQCADDASGVPCFKVSGFWAAFFASIYIAVLSFIVGLVVFQSGDNLIVIPAHNGVYI